MTRETEGKAQVSRSFFKINEEGMNVVFNWGIESYGTYAFAYYDAAQKLLERILERGNFADYDAYPILFLFRHYVEMTLKEVIMLTQRIAEIKQIELSQFKFAIHNLSTLLGAAERNLEYLKETLALDEAPFDERTTALILDLSSFDQKSDAFRYPEDNKGNPFFPDHFLVGLPEVAESMEHVHYRLIGLTEYLAVAYDNLCEMYSEFERDSYC